MSDSAKHWLPSRRFVLQLAAGILLALVAGPPVINLGLRNTRAHRALLSRMEASFGRPMEVSNFTVSLLGGLRIEANYVTVGEDPRFGNEFFLRAEQITASLRWSALLRGRLEFGNLALLRPSLNLVRDAHGNWNLLAWLPPAGFARESARSHAGSAPRLYRITADTGRINLKQWEDKHPFALVEVNGSFSQTSGGNWQMDFQAQAFRAGAMAQQPGELRVRGTIGGPRSRILPADLTVTWDEVSITDVLRLLRGKDFGLRGTLAAEARIQAATPEPTAPAAWVFKGSGRIAGLHGWQLPPRASDPALNLQFDATWFPSRARVVVRQALLESANSSIGGGGEIAWGADAATSTLRWRSAGIHLADLFAFYRAFREEVSADARLEGSAGLDAEMAGWPLRLQSFRMLAPEGRLQIPGVESSFTLQRASIQFNTRRQEFEILPLVITMPANVPERARRLVFTPAEFRLEGTLRPRDAWAGAWSLAGQARSARTAQVAGLALGLYSMRAWQSAGWELEGPLSINLKWQTNLFPFRAKPSGSIEARRATIRSPLFREPVKCVALRLDFGEHLRILVTDAESLGGRWTGTISAAAPRAWDLALRSPRVNAASFDRAISFDEDFARRGLATALSTASAEAGGSRLHGRVSLNPQVSAPFLQPLGPADLSLDLMLETLLRRSFRFSGTLAAPLVEQQSPALSQR